MTTTGIISASGMEELRRKLQEQLAGGATFTGDQEAIQEISKLANVIDLNGMTPEQGGFEDLILSDGDIGVHASEKLKTTIREFANKHAGGDIDTAAELKSFVAHLQKLSSDPASGLEKDAVASGGWDAASFAEKIMLEMKNRERQHMLTTLQSSNQRISFQQAQNWKSDGASATFDPSQFKGLGVNQAIAKAAAAMVGMDTKCMPGTNGGNLACAGAVSKVLEAALGTNKFSSLSVADQVGKLKSSGAQDLSLAQAQPGDIIYTNGHIGIVIEDPQNPGKLAAISNSSSKGSFTWIARGNEMNFSGEGARVLRLPGGAAGQKAA
jgi:hypothetical protein